GFFGNLDLVDPLELIFNRVFDGDDFADSVVDFVQCGVKRGGFAAAGRAGDEDDAVRQFKYATEAFQLAIVHADIQQVTQLGVLAEQTHDHCFTVKHGNHRNTNIHFAVFDANFNATVLRQSFFGDVEMTENLNARDDRRLKLFELGWNRNVLQHTVNAVAD